MNYIIFDLEWNNAYNYASKKGINEIVEVGAVKLDKNLNFIDSFRQYVSPVLSRKLSKHFVKLSDVTLGELKEKGRPFKEVITDFANWCDDCSKNVFLSWSNSDLYVLADNYKRNFSTADVFFMKKYADVQKYCQYFIDGISDNNQISLTDCSDYFDIDYDDEMHHHALFDCELASACLKKVFDEKVFKMFVHKCDCNYFDKLLFKDYYIAAPVTKDFNIYKTELKCPCCSSKMKRIKDYDFLNNTFKSVAICNGCGKKFWVNVRAKKVYDGVKVSVRINNISKKNK